MTATDILKLIDAGFTKEDILKLDADVKVVPTETSETPVKAEPIEQPKDELKVSEQPASQVSNGVTLSDDQFTRLLQQLNVKGASLDVPPETDIKQKLAEHFTEVSIGK